MKTITLINEYGDTIIVGRQRGGRIMLQHSDLTGADQWGEYVDADLEDITKPTAGALVLHGQPCLLSSHEVGLIRSAITQLAERPGRAGTANVLEALTVAASRYAQATHLRAVSG